LNENANSNTQSLIEKGQSLGYAFVTYESREEADVAIGALNGMHLQNKRIKVSLARPSSDGIKGANLYVCGLAKNVDQADLERIFKPFGTIISSTILHERHESATGAVADGGVGFVRFDQRAEAEAAIAALNGKTIAECSDRQPLVVKFASSPAQSAKTAVLGLPLAPCIPQLTLSATTQPVFGQNLRGSCYQPYRMASTSSIYRQV
jgi:ELAV like protein 2/3/4